MSTSRSEDEIRAEKIAAMGTDLGELHYLLWHDLTWLHFEWEQYTELFGMNASRIDVMNSTAPRFFWSLERVLWQDILLSLSRLADPTATSGQKNLTFRRLYSLVPVSGPRDGLSKALDEYEKRVAFAREWRNTLYAHRALAHASEPDVHPLPHASRASVIAALAAAADLMNVVELHYQDSTVAYASTSDHIGGAFDLLYTLDRGAAARDSDQEGDVPWTPRFK